jgi:hypothetical protein
MIKYEVVIYWSEEDEAFVAEVPELPGCAAHGATQENALGSAQLCHSSLDRHGEGVWRSYSGTQRAPLDLGLTAVADRAAACVGALRGAGYLLERLERRRTVRPSC